VPLDELLLDLGDEFLLRVGHNIETKTFEARLRREFSGFYDLVVQKVLDVLRRRSGNLARLMVAPVSCSTGGPLIQDEPADDLRWSFRPGRAKTRHLPLPCRRETEVI
jgi:hypothetical protein